MLFLIQTQTVLLWVFVFVRRLRRRTANNSFWMSCNFGSSRVHRAGVPDESDDRTLIQTCSECQPLLHPVSAHRRGHSVHSLSLVTCSAECVTAGLAALCLVMHISLRCNKGTTWSLSKQREGRPGHAAPDPQLDSLSPYPRGTRPRTPMDAYNLTQY